MPLLTYNVFEASGHQRLNFDSSVYIQYAAPPFLWHRNLSERLRKVDKNSRPNVSASRIVLSS